MRALQRNALLTAMALALASGPAFAQDEKKEIQKYQQMLTEGSPVELFELQGEALWNKPQGPKNASLQKCDLGQGPGVVKRAYATMPRYFADADRVMDLETRLVHCMMTLQGRTFDEITKRVFGNADRPSEMELIVFYVVGQSRGVKMAAPVSHPKEKESVGLGKKIFFYRAGAWDFSCASCHGEEGKRIRMQDLPILSDPSGARSYATWPAYRVSNSGLHTMQWRINDCYRQMRFPEPNFTSEATVALTHYMAVVAKGEPYDGPGTKR